MSAEGPESVPTSADPRSRRPVKKRALTPVSAQAASVDALFAQPDRPIRIPSAANTTGAPRRQPHASADIATNAQGSSAGAGSGEFHVYKASRRREYERLRVMEMELRRDQDQQAFEKNRTERQHKDDKRTRKNREKREKAKARKVKKERDANSPDAHMSQPQVSTPLKQVQNESGDGHAEDEANHLKHLAPSQERATAAAAAGGLIIHDDDRV